MSKTLTTVEAAEKLGVSRTLVHRWCKQGRLPARKNRFGFYEIRPADLDKFAAKPRPSGVKLTQTTSK